MNFPSIFRVNRPSRFNISPRHYDPVKEEIKRRTENIKRDLERTGELSPEEEALLESRVSGRTSSIRGAFTSGSPIKKQPTKIIVGRRNTVPHGHRDVSKIWIFANQSSGQCFVGRVLRIAQQWFDILAASDEKVYHRYQVANRLRR